MPPKTPNTRNWHQKKRWRIPLGLLAISMVIAAFIPDPEEEVATEAADEVTTTVAPITRDLPLPEETTSTEAPTTTTEMPTTTTGAPATTQAPTTTATEVPSVDIECFGSTIEMFDDGSMTPAEYCDFISEFTFKLNLEDAAPATKERFDQLDAWDSVFPVAQAVCTDLEPLVSTDNERTLLVVSSFGELDAATSAWFGDDLVEFAAFWGTSRGVYCRPDGV